MAARKTINFLPTIFQTDTNKKFLAATMDQLVSEPELRNVNGYIGRTFAPTYKSKDSYIIESTTQRQNYQLEPGVIARNEDDTTQIEFFTSYIDLLNKIKYYGGLVDNQDRLFGSEFYTFDPLISYDKFVNFSQYYWLPDGPDSVNVNTDGVSIEQTFTVERDATNGKYNFVSGNEVNNTIILARGGTYTFELNQPGNPFWIQTELGTDGKSQVSTTISTRDILGVTNNGEDVGTVTFTVPQSTAQDRFTQMNTVALVDYAAPLPYSSLHNHLLSVFLDEYPQYAGITGQLDGKLVVFVDQQNLNNYGESAWTATDVVDLNGNVISGYGVSSVSMSSIGDGYFSANATATFSAPDLINGIQATGNVVLTAVGVTIINGGTGYAVNDTLTVNSGTNAITVKVTGVDAGNVITSVSIIDGGTFESSAPTGEQLTSSIPSSGRFNATLEFTYGINGVTITNPGSGYNTTPTVTFNGANTSPASGTVSRTNNRYEPGAIVPDANRFGVWKVQYIDLGIDDPLVRLVPYQNINFDEKVYIKYGIGNANREFYKEYDGFLHRVPIITSIQDKLYIQDGNEAGIYAEIQIVDPTGWTIDVEADILGKSTYTSPNGVKFTSGLKIQFGVDVTPESYQNKVYYVENVGDSINLVDVEVLVRPERYNDENALNYPDTAFAEYITIKRDHPELNAWSRNNRWFHRDVIKATADYNNTTVFYDQEKRAQRPIVQFEADLQLFNSGRIGKRSIDILVTEPTDAFNELQGAVLIEAYGVTLYSGLRILFANDVDPLVKNKFYVLNLVQYSLDENDLPTGPLYIDLVKAEDGDVELYDSTVVLNGEYKGSQWWYDGENWQEAQQKIHAQQEPLFEVLDLTGTSFSTYTRSSFAGTRIFGYTRATSGNDDTVLGFPLKYRSFNTQGDIEFTNYYDAETFSYVVDQTEYTPKISSGYLQTIVDRSTLRPRNVWRKVVEPTKQYQLITYIYNGSNSPFKIDIDPASTEATIPYVKIYKNSVWQDPSLWTLADREITLASTLAEGDKIDILIYSHETSKLGRYQVPSNLDLNAQNIDLTTLTLGQIRNHLVELAHNSNELIGPVLGSSNLRDIELKQQGGNILQHSAPIPYAALFLLNDKVNFIDSIRLAQQEYARFKNKFLELSSTLNGIKPDDPAASVDLIITTINEYKNIKFPWYYSDMVPYGTLKTVLTYTVFDPLTRDYEISNVFNDQELSNKSVLVYLTPSTSRNDGEWPAGERRQLTKDREYVFRQDLPAVTFTDFITLEIDDVITFVEYPDTDGSHVPETPTKLGMYPKFIPGKFRDNTYRQPIDVIKGHDGSITPAFNDYRDDFLLELEKRIYNNLKLPDTGTYQDIFAVVPGKFRDSDYSITEVSQVLGKSFLTWVGNNKLNYSVNDTFDSNDPFTWNYSRFPDKIDGELLPGSWRACYQYFYDTVTPHLTPWEMLGFAEQPNWWESYYGPAPYTGGNTVLWDDLEAGRIVDGLRVGIDTNFARPGLSNVIPVDENGFLKSPAQILTATFNSTRASGAWSTGHQGPVEYAWRKSSDFPYAAQIALALAKPARYFSYFIDTYRYGFNYALDQYLTDTNEHVKQDSFTFNGDTSSGTIHRSASYLNWIADFLINQGIDPATKITPLLKNYEVNLAYKMAGFSDQRYLRVLAEQSSPSSTNDSIVIPDENYDVYLYKSTPVEKIVYSSVIVEKSTNGWTVRGYNLGEAFFTIIPSVINSNAYKVKILGKEVTIFRDYQPLKITVPYGYEFNSLQQVADFLISYERFLQAQGFTFNDTDDALNEIRNWKLSVKEFLYWAQQGWGPGSIIVLSPVSNVLNVFTTNSVVDEITDSQYGSKVLDQNFKLVKNVDYSVMRSPTEFKVTLNNGSVIGYAELNLVQYEHVLIFDNVTVFNDVIYKPELGNRQYRLKLVGQKTANWDGSLNAPGFIYNSGEIQDWAQGKDYLKGDIVSYKNQSYVALQNISATTEFEFAYWQVLSASEIKKGLLPNFSTIAVKSQSYYDSYVYFNDEKQTQYSHGLIGFKPRSYLSDLGLSDTTQIELYKGYIRQKGSSNSISRLTQAKFNNLNTDINFFEEWAVRIGEYGALTINPFVEIALDEKEFAVNPAVARFVGTSERSQGDGVTVFNETQLHKSSDGFTGTIALNRDDNSDYDNDIPSAGYVAIDDVSTTIFDLSNYGNLDAKLNEIGSGYTIWTAKDFAGDWNVYRVTETNNQVTVLANSLDGYITFSTKVPHDLAVNDVFLVRGFDPLFDGFYQVYKKVDITNIMVKSKSTTTSLTTLEGLGILYRLDSLRFLYMEDARQYTPPNGWKVGEKIWIDVDAATSSVQGQPYDVPSNTWKVYEKTAPWSVKQNLTKAVSEYASDDGYGTSVKISGDGLQAVAGSPFAINPTTSALTGLVTAFNVNSQNVFEEGLQIVPDATNTREFGSAIDIAVNTVDTKLAVGSPGSRSNIGYVHVYNLPVGTTTYSKYQIIAGNVNAAGRFGTSVSFDQTGLWLYVGSPDTDQVFVYGYNKNVPIQTQPVAVVDYKYIQLSGTITANIGQVLTQANTDTRMIVLANVAGGSNVRVSTLTNALIGNVSYNPGNIAVNTVNSAGDILTTSNTAVWPLSSLSGSITNTIALTFTPAVPNDATSLTISSRNSILVPNVDYSLSGTTITFSYNIPEGDYIVEQRPYYSFVTSRKGNTGSKFGYSVDSSYDGAQLAVGAPNDTVGYNGNTYIGAGAVYVYDRVIEAFDSTGSTTYTTSGNIDAVRRVSVNDIEVAESDFTVTSANTLAFDIAPEIGQVIYIETNQFNLLELLTGSVVQANAAFGTSLTICSNNCAIYVGAPYYDSGESFNTGAVFKFHNRGRLYGTNTGSTQNPTFIVGDTIRLDNFEVPVTGNVANIIITSDGNVYSQGLTATISAPNVAWGTTATVVPEVYTANGKIKSFTITNAGSGYITTPTLTLNKPSNVSIVQTAISSTNLFVPDSTGVYAGMYLDGAEWDASQYVTQVYSKTIIEVSAVPTNPSNIAGNTVVFFDKGTGGAANVTITSTVGLDQFVDTINGADILGVSAVNENGYLRLNSNKTVAKNLLRILSGSNLSGGTGVSNVFDRAGLKVFAEMQIIVNPYSTLGEYFGTKVQLASNAYMLVISSDRGTTKTRTTFDTETTVLDSGSTNIYGIIQGSGSVYIYELYDDPRDNVEHPGRYSFAQQLDPGTLNAGDRFGAAIDIYSTSLILVGAPADDTLTFITVSSTVDLVAGDIITQPTLNYSKYEVVSVSGLTIAVTPQSTDSLGIGVSYPIYVNGVATAIYITAITKDTGSVYLFENPLRTRGWNLIRYEEDKVDVDSVSRMFLYDDPSNTILTNLEFIDPAKGKILGLAEQEITYKTGYDPAVYNKGTSTKINLNTDIYWTDNQIGQVWWNLEQVRFLDYEQSTLSYRSINWGSLFPGCEVEICEWVESTVLPSQYVAAGFDGVPKYADNSAYVEVAFVDPITSIIGSKYYFWVKDKTTVDGNNPTRSLPTKTIQNYIENPKSQGIAYAAVVKNNAVILYNVGDYLSSTNTILHIDHELTKNDSIIHSEYELIQQGNGTSTIPTKIINKLFDSLSGIDINGSVVPDPKLSPADRYGISIRPRQSMFIDRLRAMTDLITYVNTLLIKSPVSRQHDLTRLYSQEEQPNIKLGEYDEKVATDIQLSYLDILRLPAGYKVLVESDTTQDGLWVLYELTAAKTWNIIKVQSYKTDLYWSLVDWFAPGYSLNDQLDYVVDTLVDALKLSPAVGSEILVRVNTGVIGRGWNLLVVNALGGYDVVGIQEGTVQFTDIGNFNVNGLGFGNQGFDSKRYDQNPNIEIRYILQALKDDIFTNELGNEFNNLFFVMVQYLFTEQKYVDWMFKTSFISVTHQLRELIQFPSYITDNQTYYQSYIEEVKPYRTSIREYLINYTGTDLFDGDITDFDLPAYYDGDSKVFRSPNGEDPFLEKDSALWADTTGPYNQWYQNRKHKVESILVEDGGLGYTTAPLVTIVGGGSDVTAATARAVIDGDTGAVIRIDVITNGSGYTRTPSVIINGSSDRPARAYAQLQNRQTRTFDTTLKFDRITYGSTVKEWTANTTFTAGDIITHTELVGNSYIRTAYLVSANALVSNSSFIESDYIRYSGANFNNANDRITAYYQPGVGMPARDLNQLLYGVEYPGVIVTGLNFNQQPGFSGEAKISLTLSNPANVANSSTLTQGNASIRVTSGGNLVTTVVGIADALGFVIDGANISINGNEVANTKPTTIEYISSTGGTPYDIGGYDNIDYDEDGNPILSERTIDTIIRSSYTDTGLGLRPEDIDVDGGKYVDTYSSHAPEELVPGIAFDTLEMRVYTKIEDGNRILGYRIFNNMRRETSYLRIADAYSTRLSADFNINDTLIPVFDATVLPLPNPVLGIPGIVFINGERITYYKNYALETTPWRPADSYASGSIVSYGNLITFSSPITVKAGDYIVQTSTGANAQVTGNVISNTAVAVSYLNSNVFTTGSGNIQIISRGLSNLKLSTSITANVGDIIAQSTTGAKVRVVETVTSDVVPVTYYSGAFNFANVTLTLNANITAPAGASLTQFITGANLIVVESAVDTNIIKARYLNTVSLTAGSGNISINGNAQPAYPSTVVSSGTLEKLTVNDAVVTVYPYSSEAQSNVIISNVSIYPAISNVDVYPTSQATAYFRITSDVPTLPEFDYTRAERVPDINVLGQIRRGTEGTAIANTHIKTSLVVDASIQQVIPGTVANTIITNTSVGNTYTVASTVAYTLRLSSDITANIGDIITQSGSGANATVYGITTNANTSIVSVTYNDANRFNLANIFINLSGNITANVGDYITQPTSGSNLANLIVLASVTNSSNITVQYVDVYSLTSERYGNIKVNGAWPTANVYPTAITNLTTGTTTLAFNGSSSNVYPLAVTLAGYNMNSVGNVTIAANTTLNTSNTWSNVSANLTAGSFELNTISEQILFLKDEVATEVAQDTYPGPLLTEDAINIVITEITEDELNGD